MSSHKEFHVEQASENEWEVRDRADVWHASFESKREAQAFAKVANRRMEAVS